MEDQQNNSFPRKIKILHLSATKSWGGGGNHIENLCYELSLSNPEVENIIVVGENGQFHNRLKKKNFRFHTLPLSFNIDPRAIFKFLSLVAKEEIDIVHIHGSTSLTIAIIAAHLKKVPPYIFSKKTSFPIKNRKLTLYKYNHPNLKKILCVSNATKEISAQRILDTGKLKTIYHGTRLDNKSTVTPFSLREKFNISAEAFIIGNIGNHIWAKNLETYIKCANELINVKKTENLYYVQIGSFTRETEQLKLLVQKYNLEEYFSFLGFIPDASNFIPQFDTTVITSKSEGIPQVIYESFYHKTPVISTNVGGISEVIEHNKNGLLVDAYDYKEIGNHILRLIKNKPLQHKFAEISKEKLHQYFTSEIMAKETLKIYKDIINGRS